MNNLINFKKYILSLNSINISENQLQSFFNSFYSAYLELKDTIKIEDEILDVGCGAGILINYLNSQGYKVQGFDNYQFDSIAKIVNNKINSSIDVRDCNVLEYKSNKFFDVILLNNVIEHFENWEESISVLNDLLSPKGKIIILFPNYNFPFDIHFMLPIIINKKITYKIFKKKIKNFEFDNNFFGLWDSLNFIKPREIKNFYRNKNFILNIDKKYFPNLLEILIVNINKKSMHKKSIFYKTIIFLAKCVYKSGLIKLYKFAPLRFHPFIKITVERNNKKII